MESAEQKLAREAMMGGDPSKMTLQSHVEQGTAGQRWAEGQTAFGAANPSAANAAAAPAEIEQIAVGNNPAVAQFTSEMSALLGGSDTATAGGAKNPAVSGDDTTITITTNHRAWCRRRLLKPPILCAPLPPNRLWRRLCLRQAQVRQPLPRRRA